MVAKPALLLCALVLLAACSGATRPPSARSYDQTQSNFYWANHDPGQQQCEFGTPCP